MTRQIALLVFFLLVSISISVAKPSLRELTTKPSDSLLAEQMRIWVPVEASRVKFEIFIRDRRQIDVRHLFNNFLQQGYYNFYWDKKDDSGRFVPEGKYHYYLFGGSYKSKKEIVVSYQPGENLIYFDAEKLKPKFDFEITEDSVLVSMIMESNLGIIVDTVFIDSTFNKGEYHFNWEPSDEIKYGRYKAKITVNGYLHSLYLRYTK